MSYQEFFKRLLTVALLIVLLLGLWYLRSVVMLAFLSVIVAVFIHLPARRLERIGLKHGLAVTISAVGVALVSTLLTLRILPIIVIEIANLIAIAPEALLQGGSLYEEWRLNSELLRQFLPPLESEEFGYAQALLGMDQGDLNTYIFGVINSMLPLLQGIGNVLFTFLANLTIVIFISIFLLVEPTSYMKGILLLTPRQYHERATQICHKLISTIEHWLRAQAISVSITVFLVWFILGVLMGMPYALIVAIFAGFATFVPNIGAFLPLIPIVIFTLAQDPSKLLLVAPAYLLIQFFESNVITPYVDRSQLHIPSGGLLLFQVISTLLFGSLGLLLAVPLLAILLVLVREIYSYGILGLQDISLTWPEDLPTVGLPDAEGTTSLSGAANDIADLNLNLQENEVLT